MDVDTSGLLREAETRFVLGSSSVHGPTHSKAVLANGMTLANALDADRIELRRVGIESAKRDFCDRTWSIAQQILANSRIDNAHRV